MIFYLCGPIDFEADKGSGWRDELKKLSRGPNNIAFFDPVAPYTFNNLTQEVSQYIYGMNMLALDKADGVVARIMEGQTSIGSPIELYYAKSINKPIILITNMKKSVYIKYLSAGAKIVESVEAAYQEILGLENPVPETLRDMKFV